PKWIKDKKAVINVNNKDNLCFLYSIIAKLYPAKDHTDRPSKYSQYINSFKTDGLKFPMKIDDIHKFERMNDLSIYVYSYDVDTKKIFTFRAPKLYNNDDDESKIIDLLYTENEDGSNSHYSLINDLSRLRSEERRVGKVCRLKMSRKN